MCVNGIVCHTLNIPGKPRTFECTDDQSRQIKLIPPHTVKGIFGKRVVVVVPALTESEEPDDPVVPALIRRFERPPAKRMADGVHAPRNVRCEKYAYEASPQKSGETAESKGYEECKRDPEKVQAVDEHDESVAKKIRGVLLRIGKVR